MKRALATTILMVLLVSAIAGMHAAEMAGANFIPYGTITIISPANQTYNSNFLILNFTATFSVTNNKTITYSIDKKPQITVTGLEYTGDELWETTNRTLALPYLSKGSHLIEMYAKTNSTTILPGTGYASVYFTINGTSGSPSPTIAPTSSTSEPPTPTMTPSSTPNPTPSEQAIPKPSIPEFTVKLFISQTENKSIIQFTIKNQPFDKSLNYSLYYNVRYLVSDGNWKEVYRPDDGYPTQSDSDFTTLLFSSSTENEHYFLDTSTNPPWSFAIVAPANSILDLQLEAMIGYIHRVFNPNATDQLTMYPYVFTGEKSGWSNTQTLTIDEASSSATPLPSPLLTVSLSESASALNLGNKINFTVSVDGGNAPYVYAWFLDNQLVENSTSPYYATDSQGVGSHHVYVQVNDANGNSAMTLSVEFNVLPVTNYSSSPTLQPTAYPSPIVDGSANYLFFLLIGIVIVMVLVVISLLIHLKKHKR